MSVAHLIYRRKMIFFWLKISQSESSALGISEKKYVQCAACSNYGLWSYDGIDAVRYAVFIFSLLYVTRDTGVILW